MTNRPIAFVDTETTGLDPYRHDAWEIAIILRRPNQPDIEHLFQIRTSLVNADPKALEINRRLERFAVPDGEFAAKLPTATRRAAMELTEATLMHDLMDLLDGAMLVGSNPAFDERFLMKLFHEAGCPPRWYYRTVDIATMAVGHLYGQAYTLAKQNCDAEYYGRADSLLSDGWRSYELSRLMGIEPPTKEAAHTALGDARWARDVYDAITKADAFCTTTDEQLVEMVCGPQEGQL
ncbi:3'-5' exonuclease [Streptomyces gardneri]|uniref:3'-5' exonuclease n=1 Tax=Streptomyces gardneri TaxID=66892 RepID=UPI0035DE3FDA